MEANVEFYDNISNVADKVSHIIGMTECIVAKVETRDYSKSIPNALYAVITLCKALQADINSLASGSEVKAV